MQRKKPNILKLKTEIKTLKSENKKLKMVLAFKDTKPKVKAPKPFAPFFKEAEETVGEYFKSLKFTPSKGTIN